MSSSEYTRGSPSDCEDRISPRRAHCPIVVPDTPASSPTSPARKVPWALGLATTALKVCAGAADERPRAATIARAPVDRDVAQSSVGVEPRWARTPLTRGSLYDARVLSAAALVLASKAVTITVVNLVIWGVVFPALVTGLIAFAVIRSLGERQDNEESRHHRRR